MLSKFVEGLKLFFSSKRLKWLTLVFALGAVLITLMERVVVLIPSQVTYLLALLTGGIFPTFFMFTAFLSLVGLARFVASDESYARSVFFTIIWMVASVVVLLLLIFVIRDFFNIMFIGVAFLGWIGFQSYFSTRASLGYAESAAIESKSKLVGLLYGFLYILNYVLIVGSFIVTSVLNVSIIFTATWFLAILGVLLAAGFNFLNGWVLLAERNKSTASSIAFLGLFISSYSAYFIYNVLKGFDASLDLLAMGISIFFIIYTMSNIGRTLASRAELDTRWKLSKELAATFTFFLASGYMFTDAMFTVILADTNPALAGVVGDIIKLIIFPFVAFIMELNFIRKSRKMLKEAPMPEALPATPIEDEEQLEEEPEIQQPQVDNSQEMLPEDSEFPEDSEASSAEVLEEDTTEASEEDSKSSSEDEH